MRGHLVDKVGRKEKRRRDREEEKPSNTVPGANTIGKHYTNIYRSPSNRKIHSNSSTLSSPTTETRVERKTRLAFLLPPGTPSSSQQSTSKIQPLIPSILSFLFDGAVQEWAVKKLRKLADKLLLKVAVRVVWKWGKELVA